MFDKKNDEPKQTYEERAVYLNQRALLRIANHVVSQVEVVLVKNAVIALYPEGADKIKAEQDAESARKVLLYRISDYDAQRAENMRYAEICQTTIPKEWDMRTSHEIVESAYRSLMINKN